MFKIVVFDFNGTLLDDVWLWCESIVGVCASCGVAIDADEALRGVRSVFDGDFYSMYKAWGLGLSEEEVWRRYAQLYDSQMSRCDLFSDVPQALTVLRERGVVTYLVSAAPEHRVTPILRAKEIDGFFRQISCGVRDKAERLREIALQEDVSPWDICMVGDTPADARHAREAGCYPVLLVRGHFRLEDARAHPEDHPVESLVNLLDLLPHQPAR